MFLLGWLDHSTGWELSVYVFYAVPILLVVWQGERRLAVILAVLSGVVWWLANMGDHPYGSEWSYNWASLGRVAYFVLVALGGNSIWARQEMDRVMIETLEHMRRLEREIVVAGEHEQQRIGRDLHDGLCQHLAAIGFAARSLADDLGARSLPEAREAREIEELLSDSVVQARDLARGICPVLPGGVELELALEELAQTTKRLTGMEVTFQNECGAQMLEPGAAMHLYRIAQEALNNALRHSGGTKVNIILSSEGETVRLTVVDDGSGPPVDLSACKGMGIKTMEYRSHALGSTLEIRRHYPRGTLVSCVCNIQKQHPHGNNH